MPNISRDSRAGGTKSGSASMTTKLPFFLEHRISYASGSKPGATMPSEMTRFRKRAVAASTLCDSATKSPKELFGSAPRART